MMPESFNCCCWGIAVRAKARWRAFAGEADASDEVAAFKNEVIFGGDQATGEHQKLPSSQCGVGASISAAKSRPVFFCARRSSSQPPLPRAYSVQ